MKRRILNLVLIGIYFLSGIFAICNLSLVQAADTTTSTDSNMQDAINASNTDTRSEAQRNADDQKALSDAVNSKTNTTTPDTSSTDNILGISQDRLRTGNISYTDIPLMIVSAIEFLLRVAGSISVVALIYHAVRMQLASGITGDSSGVDKAKKGMYGAMFGFVLSMSGWFLMTKFVALLSGSV